MASVASVARSSMIMTAGTLVSRMLGFVKTMLLATAIGVTVGGAADAFDVANKVPNNLYMLLAGGVLNAVLVPQIIRASKQKDGGQDFTNRLLTLTLMLLLVVTVVATAAAPFLVRLYSSAQWSADQTALSVAFAYWCLPQIFFYGLYTLLGQVLNAKSSFGPYMWAPVLNNIVAILGLVVFIYLFGTGQHGENGVGTWDSFKIMVLAGSATLGVVCQALVLLWPLHRIGFRYRPKWGFRGVGLGTAGRVASWTFMAVLIGQLGYIVTSRVASTASSTTGEAVASNAAYSVAYLVFMLPHSLVAVSLATALFTSMSSAAANRDLPGVKDSLSLGLRLIGLVNVFATVCFVVLGAPIAMVLGGGTQQQAAAIGVVVITMGIGLVPFSANYFLQRVFYAFEDARTPFWVQVPQVIVTAVGVLMAGYYLPDRFTVAGIGLAMSMGYVLSLVSSAYLLRRQIHHIGTGDILYAHLKFLAAGVVAGGIGAVVFVLAGPAIWATRLHAFITVVVLAGVMLVIYLGVCWLLRVSELHTLVATVKRKLNR